MSTKIIIKRKEEKFQWTQTEEAITLYFPVRNVLLKNVDLLYTPEFIKINVTSIKYIAIVDFAHLIENENIKNKIQLQDEGLEVYLMKAESARHHWDEIQLRGLTREELIKRREESLNRHYKREEEKFKEAADLKIKMDKHTVDQQMKVEDFQRKQLKKAKEEQKQLAEDELYHTLDSLEEQNQKLLQQKHQMEQQQQSKDQIKQQQTSNKENQKQASNKVSAPIIDSSQNTKNFSFKSSNKEKDIFGDEDEIETVPSNFNFQNNLRPSNQQTQKTKQNIEKEQHTYVEEITEEEAKLIEQQQNQIEPEPVIEVPEVRNKQDVKVPFTEKKFPHLPARESQLKEPPYPRSKTIDKKKDDVYIDIEDKDPVWLKDKGDHFFKRNDYYSATNAYSKALEIDKEFMTGRLNRATAFIKMRAFQNCIDDCTDIETQIMALKESEREDEFYQKLLARLYVKRGAASSWVQLFDQAVDDLTKATVYKGVFSEVEINEILKDIERIKLRQKSQLLKQEGDDKFIANDLDGAIQLYFEALKHDDTNEYAHANLGLIYMKRSDYQKCIEYSTRALDILDHFMNDTKSFQKDNRLEVKVLLRRGKSYEMLDQIENAKEDLDKAVSLEPQNGEAKTLLKKVQEKLDNILFEQYNKQANEFQKQGNFSAALEFYEKCLKLTRKATSLDNIAVYVNKIACLLSLEKHDRVVQECNDALRLIKNFKNRNDDKQSVDEKKRLVQMEIRVSVRRGNALAKLNRVTDAIQEYERALKLDPQNQAIQKDLDVLRKGL